MSTQLNCQITFLFQAIQFSQTVLFQTVQLSNSIFFVDTQLNIKTDLFQTIQFCISWQFSSIWPIDRNLAGATIPGQSEPGSDGNERILCIPQSSSITGTSSLDCLVSYLGYSLGGGGLITLLQRCSRCILQSQLTGKVAG